MQNTNLLTNSSNNRPPRNAATDSEDAFLSAATSGAASSMNLWSAYTDKSGVAGAPKGKVWLELEAVANDCYVRFCRTATTATTSSNGALCKVGIPRYFYIEPSQVDKFIDVLATGVGVLKYRVVGPIGERSRQ